MGQIGREDSENDVSEPSHARLFDPAGLLLVGIVGAGGILLLLRHGWILGAVCVVLASLGLITSHRRFRHAMEHD